MFLISIRRMYITPAMIVNWTPPQFSHSATHPACPLNHLHSDYPNVFISFSMFYLNISWFIQFSSFFFIFIFLFHLIYSPIKNYFQFKGNVCMWMDAAWMGWAGWLNEWQMDRWMAGLNGCMADGCWLMGWMFTYVDMYGRHSYTTYICEYQMKMENIWKWNEKKKWRKIENKRKTEKCWIFLCCRHCWCLTCKIIFIRYTSTYHVYT